MGSDDWCHFSQRVRSTHRQVKAAELGYEMKFSFTAFSSSRAKAVQGG